MSRLSHRGSVLAFAAVACLAVAAMAALGGEAVLAVTLATAAGGLALGLTARDALGTPPSTTALFVVATVCGLGALASLPGQRWFTAAALAGVSVMTFARAVGKWVPDGRAEDAK